LLINQGVPIFVEVAGGCLVPKGVGDVPEQEDVGHLLSLLQSIAAYIVTDHARLDAVA
jgi:hypothetical protein